MHIRIVAWAAGAVLLALLAAVPAGADGDFGPDTCLNGFVWREARPTDHVCVTPDIRTQTSQDNALAASRRNPKGGAFGPDTCLTGFVWREAYDGDHVCVTPATRDEAKTDNAQAVLRRDAITTTAIRDLPTLRWKVRSTQLNVGQARIYLFNIATRRSIRSWTVTVNQSATAPGGSFYVRLALLSCRSTPNAYFRVLDLASTRWSTRIPVCARV
jgi:hypothetical protein